MQVGAKVWIEAEGEVVDAISDTVSRVEIKIGAHKYQFLVPNQCLEER